MADDGYPTHEELQRIREWNHVDGLDALLDFVHSIWWAAGWGWSQTQRRYRISTGGWSGNEDIIDALQANFIFWSVCFVSHRRGGHFEFEVPRSFRKKAQHG